MPSFDEVLAQPLDEIKTSLNGAQYRELQGFCSHVGVNAAGKQADLLARAIDYVEKLKSTAVHASPLKPCLKRASTTPTSAEPAGKFQELSPLPAVQPLPGFQPASDPKSAGQNTIIETISEAELDAAQGGFEAMEDDSWADTAKTAGPQAPPSLTEIPAPPDGADPGVWTVVGSMFDAKL